MSNITHYGYTPEQIKGMADEIERLRIKELELIHVCEDKDAEIERLRAALESYACYGIGKCTEQRLKDGSCIREMVGTCGDEARRALEGK